MTKEELLKPRYIVIAHFPYSGYKIGDIICGNIFQLYNEDYIKHECASYPALFNSIGWWEERDEKDMPEYVKYKGTDYLRYGCPQVNEIVKVESFCEDSINSKYGCDWIIFYEPATEEEFLNQ
jgi:hypothetical protein